MDYYASYKNSKAPSLLRKELVSYALRYGNQKAVADNKRMNGAMIKREYSIPYSGKTIVKYLKQYYKLPSKKTHRQKKRDMRDVKSKYRAFEKIQVDIKYLDESPNIRLDTIYSIMILCAFAYQNTK